MPRTARKKSEVHPYHIFCRSISEVDLFRNEGDKFYYISLLKRYISKNGCSIYAFVLMDNHVHFCINTNGFDISKFMHSLNLSYTIYYNKKYERHGHLFQGRFGSKIIESDQNLLAVLAYIHNNPKDIPQFSGKESEYEFSSYGAYLGKPNLLNDFVETDFVLRLFSKDKGIAIKKADAFTKVMKDTEIINEVEEEILKEYTETEYRDEKKYIERNVSPEIVIKKVCSMLGKSPNDIRLKYIRKAKVARALTVYWMRFLCGYTFKKICEYIGDMTLSGILRLSNEGYRLYSENTYYQEEFKTLLQAYAK